MPAQPLCKQRKQAVKWSARSAPIDNSLSDLEHHPYHTVSISNLTIMMLSFGIKYLFPFLQSPRLKPALIKMQAAHVDTGGRGKQTPLV